MSKRVLSLLLVGAVALAGLALAQDPPAKDEPPVRLKKKRPRGDDKPMVEQDEKKKDDKKDEKKEDKKAEAPEPEPVTPQEEEKEVFQRVVTNVHKVGDRLAKNDLGEATQQTQRDILKDLDSLIRRNEEPPQGGGQQDQNNGGGGGGDDQDNKGKQGGGGQGQKQKGSGSKAQGKSNGGGQNSGGGQKNQGKKGRDQSGAKAGTEKQRSEKNGGKGSEKAGGKNAKGGNGGGGNAKEERTPNRAADQYKDIWGHLPQTLRAQMDAYSNPQPFLPKYDDLIKRYYRTIAEQGRRKGD